MAITLTHVATGQALPVTQVHNYEATIAVPTVVHTIIGRGAPDFTIKPAGPRTGAYELFCLDETAAIALRSLLLTPGPFTLADTATSIANTTFMVTGDIGVQLDQQTLKRCIVRAAYTEVTA